MAVWTRINEILCYGCGTVLWHKNRQIKAMVLEIKNGDVRGMCKNGCREDLPWLTPGIN